MADSFETPPRSISSRPLPLFLYAHLQERLHRLQCFWEKNTLNHFQEEKNSESLRSRERNDSCPGWIPSVNFVVDMA